MKVIMLKGPHSCGKTTVLNLVYDMLVDTHGAAVKKHKSPLGGNKKDFEAVLDYNGTTVAIYTMGDYSCAVTDAMQKYASCNADVLIIACNDRFKRPLTAIKKYPNAIIQKTKNTQSKDEGKANEIIAKI